MSDEIIIGSFFEFLVQHNHHQISGLSALTVVNILMSEIRQTFFTKSHHHTRSSIFNVHHHGNQTHFIQLLFVYMHFSFLP